MERSLQSIYERVRKLNIKTNYFWSEQELNTLINYYKNNNKPKIDIENLTKLLPNRSRNTIVNKAASLGLCKKKKQWTEKEIDILKQSYCNDGVMGVIRQLTDRTATSILQMATKLGLKYNDLNKWTEEQVNVIKKYYENYGPDYCANIIKNKNKKQCSEKAMTLGIKFRKSWTEEENKILIENYSDNGPDYCEKYINRNRSSIIAQAEALGLKFNRYKKDIICVENNMVFHSLKDAQQYAKTGSVCSVLDKNDKTAGGYHWCSLEKYDKENYIIKEKDKPSNAIKLHCIETDEIFYSINEASNKTGLSHYVIKQILDGKTNRKYRFTFDYIKEENKND